MDTLPFPDIQADVGKEVLVTDWLTIAQDDVDKFADATGDHQWIHVDVDRARRESPFGQTIAHGFMTLSLMPRLSAPYFADKKIRQGLNYGCDKVRFPGPLPVGSRVRGRFSLSKAEPGPMGALKCTLVGTVEVDGADKPACVAEQIVLLFP